MARARFLSELGIEDDFADGAGTARREVKLMQPPLPLLAALLSGKTPMHPIVHGLIWARCSQLIRNTLPLQAVVPPTSTRLIMADALTGAAAPFPDEGSVPRLVWTDMAAQVRQLQWLNRQCDPFLSVPCRNRGEMVLAEMIRAPSSLGQLGGGLRSTASTSLTREVICYST